MSLYGSTVSEVKDLEGQGQSFDQSKPSYFKYFFFAAAVIFSVFVTFAGVKFVNASTPFTSNLISSSDSKIISVVNAQCTSSDAGIDYGTSYVMNTLRTNTVTLSSSYLSNLCSSSASEVVTSDSADTDSSKCTLFWKLVNTANSKSRVDGCVSGNSFAVTPTSAGTYLLEIRNYCGGRTMVGAGTYNVVVTPCTK
jgi:hypothetical protein